MYAYYIPKPYILVDHKYQTVIGSLASVQQNWGLLVFTIHIDGNNGFDNVWYPKIKFWRKSLGNN